MATVPTAPLAASGLIGGFAAGRYLHRRDLAGVISAAALAWCAPAWARAVGPGAAAGLAAVYVGGLGVSHPLAKRIGAWPAVVTVSAISAATAAAADRQRAKRGG
jgi:hypothetical protein